MDFPERTIFRGLDRNRDGVATRGQHGSWRDKWRRGQCDGSWWGLLCRDSDHSCPVGEYMPGHSLPSCPPPANVSHWLIQPGSQTSDFGAQAGPNSVENRSGRMQNHQADGDLIPSTTTCLLHLAETRRCHQQDNAAKPQTHRKPGLLPHTQLPPLEKVTLPILPAREQEKSG